MKKATTKRSNTISTYLILISTAAALIPIYLTFRAGDPLFFIIPNALLFTSFRSLTFSKWSEAIKINTAITRTPAHVPIIFAKDYTFDVLRVATENFRYPAVVRGLFSDTPAAKKWVQPGYLSELLGDFDIPVIANSIKTNSSAHMQNHRVLRKFGPAYEV